MTSVHLRHTLSALAAIFMLLLALGSKKPSGEAAGNGPPPEAADKKEVDAYIAKLGAAYAATAALAAKNPLASKKCDAAAIMKKAPPGKDDYGVREISHVYGPYMARFATNDKGAWTKRGGPWEWLTDQAFGGHFEDHPDGRAAMYVSDTAKRIRDTFLPQRYLLVVWPRNEATNKMPKYASGKIVEEGKFEGWFFLVDVVDGIVECHSTLAIESFTTRTKASVLRESDPEKKLTKEFEDTMETALKQSLPSKVRFSNMGSIF